MNKCTLLDLYCKCCIKPGQYKQIKEYTCSMQCIIAPPFEVKKMKKCPLSDVMKAKMTRETAE